MIVMFVANFSNGMAERQFPVGINGPI